MKMVENILGIFASTYISKGRHKNELDEFLNELNSSTKGSFFLANISDNQKTAFQNYSIY